MFRGVTTFLRKRQVEQELDDELRASIDLLAEEHIRQGVSPQEAVRLARIELGGIEKVKEEVRDTRGLPMLDSVIPGFHHALRNLVRASGFSIAVVVTLGLGLGANAAVLALLDKLILRPLPVQEPSRLVVVNAPRLPERPSRGPVIVFGRRGSVGGGLSYPLYAALRSRVRAFTGVLADHRRRRKAGNRQLLRAPGSEAALGRLLTPADDEPAGGSPVVLSHGLCGGAPAILHRTIRLNRHPMTVVGVTAQGFTGTAAGAAPDFYSPLHMGGVLPGRYTGFTHVQGDGDHLYSFWLSPGQAGYDPVRSSAILAQVFELLGGIPGVRGVSIATELPLSGRGTGTSVNSDGTSDQDLGEPVETEIARASPGHFANLGIAMVAGREFSRDDVHGPKVVVINEALAQRLFGKSDPIGRGLGVDGGRPEWRVVGIVKDIKPGPRVPGKLILYKPYNFQDPSDTSAAFALRVQKGVRLTSEMVRATVRRVETAVAVDEFASMPQQAARALYRDRMLAWVSLSFAMLAALLCAIGIFGLTSFSVTKRAQEIAIRIALGATRASIQWMVMREVFLLAAVGCGLGLMAFLYGGRVLSTMLFELTPSEPASLATGAVVLGGTAFLAGLLPAYRATLMDPACTLRQE